MCDMSSPTILAHISVLIEEIRLFLLAKPHIGHLLLRFLFFLTHPRHIVVVRLLYLGGRRRAALARSFTCNWDLDLRLRTRARQAVTSSMATLELWHYLQLQPFAFIGTRPNYTVVHNIVRGDCVYTGSTQAVRNEAYAIRGIFSLVSQKRFLPYSDFSCIWNKLIVFLP